LKVNTAVAKNEVSRPNRFPEEKGQATILRGGEKSSLACQQLKGKKESFVKRQLLSKK